MKLVVSALLLLAVVGNTWANFNMDAAWEILNAHNLLRSQVARGTYQPKASENAAPAGAGILKLRWNNGLAISAQEYADTCQEGPSNTPVVGENIAVFYTDSAPSQVSDFTQYGKRAFDSWEKEFVDNGFKSLTMDAATLQSGVSHATQLIWGATRAVGCGVTDCGLDAAKNQNKIIVVCQYKAAGNVPNAKVYEEGKACSACPQGTKCDQSYSLCYYY